MSISAISGSDAYLLYQQRQLELKALGIDPQSTPASPPETTPASADLSVGPLDSSTGAEGSQEGNSSSSGASNSPTWTQFKTDLTNLASALQSGDASQIQAALSAYAQDQQSFGDAGTTASADAASAAAPTHRHHHHHHGHSQAADSTATGNPADSNSIDAVSAADGELILQDNGVAQT